jgi:hypothetical protein
MPPHPITITIKPGDLFLLKDLLPYPLGLQWTSPHLIIPMTPTAVKLNGFPQWWHPSLVCSRFCHVLKVQSPCCVCP